MVIKDRLVSWFIRNIIIPRNEIIDVPGFIVLKLSDDKYTINLREILLPESIFIEIENCVAKKYGYDGKQILYSVGKKFGYRFAHNSNYPTLKKSSEKAFSKFVSILIRYLEAIYAKRISHTIDFKNKKFEIKSDGYIVCSKNGLGYILTEGAISGVWAYGMEDSEMEGVQSKCQGRGDEFCEVICAPKSYLEKHRINFFKERNLSNLDIERKKYNYFNSMEVEIKSMKSFKDLINSDVITHRGGIIEYRGERLLLIESSIMYLLEKELKKLNGGLDVLWKISFDFGKNLAKRTKLQKPGKFIMGLFPALGFGDILVMEADSKYSITLNHFPWTRWSKDIDFVMLRGMLSGVISGFAGFDVKFDKVKKHITRNGFSLSISE
jgi:hypothetical protein